MKGLETRSEAECLIFLQCVKIISVGLKLNRSNCNTGLNFSLTAIFTLVVSSAVLVYDVSARAGDVSMGSPSLLLAEFVAAVRKIRRWLGCVRVRPMFSQ